MIKRVTAHKIYDAKFDNWQSEVHDKWTYDDFIAAPKYKKEWVSVTSLLSYEKTRSIFLGIGSFSAELLWRFDRDTGKITSMGYEKVADKYDAKFHRSMELDGDVLYAAPALFHDPDKQFEAPGARVIAYDIPSGKFEFLGLPAPKVYAQSIALDKKRKIIYGFGLFPEVFWSFDLKTRESKQIAFLGSSFELGQSHNPVIDAKGRVWGTYGIIRAFAYQTGPDSIRLFCYDPDNGHMEFYKHGLPGLHSDDKGKADTAHSDPDGYIYFGTTEGCLARLDPETAVVTPLWHKDGCRRLAGLVRHPDGLLYGTVGEHEMMSVFAFDTKTDKLVWEAPICDEAGQSPVRIHHLIVTQDGRLFGGENDNNVRSSYLWEIEV